MYILLFECLKSKIHFLNIIVFDFTFRYHLGSLAFGSLLIAIVQIVRVILEYVDSKLNGSENRIAKFLLK